MRNGKYILEGKSPVACDDLMKWAEWMGEGWDGEQRRQVGRTAVGPFTVSTVFLGIDHNFYNEGEPILFETMIFEVKSTPGKPRNLSLFEFQTRYRSWEEAERGHAIVVASLEQGQVPATLDSAGEA